MELTDIEQKPGCLQTTLTILGEKWTALILRDLSISPKTFSNLEKGLAGISPRTLSQRLNKLELEGIISKSIYCQRPPRFEYILTEKGEALKNVLTSMADWGAKYCP
ncbi:MAG TPA: helix-turn-helix domain-containing protein [Patescibacteria group bacterium]|nr:helix-turn-helix domain-containing protein [Patescibacteria group bacterium]